LNRGTHFLAQAMDGDPAPPIASPKTFRRQDRSISFGPRPSQAKITSSLSVRLVIFVSATEQRLFGPHFLSISTVLDGLEASVVLTQLNEQDQTSSALLS
jgi:hypothetical protein